MNRPPAEIPVDVATVRRLLEAECPRLIAGPIRLVGEGWDNYTFRVGRLHAVRLPRREAGVAPLLNEQRWLPILARRLPIEVSAPVHVGEPSELFGWPWSVVKWIRGSTAESFRFRAADAVLLAQTLAALHHPAPEDAPTNPYRGVPLWTRAEAVEGRLEALGSSPGIDGPRLRALWQDTCATPATQERAWMHGDLHPFNVVVRDGGLAGLIDWGDLNGGDAATDVACAWMLIDSAQHRRAFFDTYGASDQLVRRALGWAIHMGLLLVASGEPGHVSLGLAALDRIVADDGRG